MPSFPNNWVYGDTGCCTNTLTECTVHERVANPVIEPDSQSFVEEVEVSITLSTFGATIYYTTDGSTPTADSTPYTVPFTVTSTTTVKAIGLKAGACPSDVVSETYTQIPETVATPDIEPPSTSFSGSLEISITCSTVGSTIYYTTDGSTPTPSSTEYSVPFNIGATTTVKAIAVAVGLSNSAVATETYTLVAGTFEVYWGYSSSTTLDEAGVLALQDSNLEADPYRQYVFDASSTVNDYFYYWFPDVFPVPTAVNGFLDNATATPLVMATDSEGFVDGPTNGWYYLDLTVDGVPGKLYRSFFQLGGGGAFTSVVQ